MSTKKDSMLSNRIGPRSSNAIPTGRAYVYLLPGCGIPTEWIGLRERYGPWSTSVIFLVMT